MENEGDDTTDWSARTVILACRNLDRAQKAKESLISKYFGRRPSLGAAVLVVQQLDLSVPDSVFQACAELATKFTKIDTLFLNAGFIPIKGVDLWAGINNFVTRPSYVAKTGGDVIQQHTGVLTPDGLGDCFTANVFGHWILVRELMKKKLLLSPSNSDTPAGKVIWFSSTTADPDFFDPKDYQCIKGSHPYESSKRLCELLSFHLSKTNDAQSFVCSPGNCQSNIIQGVISAWLLTAVLYFVRKL